MPHILLLNQIHPDAEKLLRETAGFTVETLQPVEPAVLRERVPHAHAIIVRMTPIDRALIDAAECLKLVCRHGVGYDSVDVPALTARGIPLTVTPDANAVSVAEHAMMLMLACARRVDGYNANLRLPKWGAQPDLPSFDLAGRTVLVVGFGRIGGRVSRLCAAFGMRVLVHDPIVPNNTIKGAGFEPVRDRAAALAEADVVTLHAPSDATTRGMVDAGFLGAMKRGAVLVNTARGTLVDEAALEAALRSGQLAAAGIDVFHTEPVTTKLPILELPNLIATPHSAAGSVQSMHRMALSCADSVLRFFEGALDPDVVVNREVLGRNA